MDRIYLDHNATTPVCEEVVLAMAHALREVPGNPSSRHAFGREAAAAYRTARRQVAGAAGCEEGEVVFTSGGTEADNLALRGLLHGERSHLVTAPTEHEAILETAAALERRGIEITLLPVDREGRIDPDALAAAVRRGESVVSLMAANNETGVLLPLERVGRICRDRGALFHSDAVQFFGKLPFAFADLPIDLASISGHKIGGPKGIGALIVREGIEVTPLVTGGGQEGAVRPGTENLPGIVGFGKAAERASGEAAEEAARLAALRDGLEAGIRESLPRARIHGDRAERLPNTSNVGFPGISGEDLLIALDLEGIAVSTGAACNAGASEPSHVLRAMGYPSDAAGSSIRFSLGRATTIAEIERVLATLPRLAARLEGSKAPF